ncbi:MAG: hypothetical protein IPM25_13550 [Chloracidobacterium sp.]|nr:hypothetical protein [Chloracidobacterium sp.]
MLKIVISTIFLFTSSSVFGQAQTQPTPDYNAERLRQQRAMEARRESTQRSMDRLGAISDRLINGKPINKETVENIKELYREPTEKELKNLQPAAEDLRTYASFLRSRRTGIVRLEPYKECGDGTKVVSVSEHCLEYSMPGNGSDYSFRERNYRLGRLADLRFDGDGFSSPGLLQLGVFVGLGDIPLDKVTTNTLGMAFITDLKPAKSLPAAAELGQLFRSGTEDNGYYYASAVRAVEGMTYVLRSVAYRGKLIRSIGGAVFNELDFDERADVTVAFRIIRRYDSGGIAILWKELNRTKAPELERETPETMIKNPFAEAELGRQF